MSTLSRPSKILRECLKPFYRLGRQFVDHYELHYAKDLSYWADGMKLNGKTAEFLKNERFMQSYRRGMNSGHKICRPKDSSIDIHIEWRAHLACWAASHARHLPGDLVECGVNTGMYSLAICEYLDINTLQKNFYLFDTYCGIPEEQMNAVERSTGFSVNSLFYEECFDRAKANFASFPRAHLVRGRVPETLTQVTIDQVCYLSIDMNIAAPEIAALEFFWDKLVHGAVVLLDDYALEGHQEQHRLMDEFAGRMGVEIASLPTGQGLLIKP